MSAGGAAPGSITEHLLLGLTRRDAQDPTLPASVLLLEQLGLDPAEVRRQTLEVVAQTPAPPARARPRDNVLSVRVDDRIVDALDALIEAGVYETRSEAAARAVLEERVLRAELPGYDTYMAQVKYRFIPHVW